MPWERAVGRSKIVARGGPLETIALTTHGRPTSLCSFCNRFLSSAIGGPALNIGAALGWRGAASLPLREVESLAHPEWRDAVIKTLFRTLLKSLGPQVRELDLHKASMFFAHHCCVMEGHLPNACWPASHRKGGLAFPTMVCTRVPFLMHGDCEHMVHTNGSQMQDQTLDGVKACIEEVSKIGAWGGNLEVAALAATLDRPIAVLHEQGQVFSYNPEGAKKDAFLYCTTHPGHYEALDVQAGAALRRLTG